MASMLPYTDYFESIGGFETLNDILGHPNAKIYEMAKGLLEIYFKREGQDEVDNVFSQSYQNRGGHLFDDEDYHSDEEEGKEEKGGAENEGAQDKN